MYAIDTLRLLSNLRELGSIGVQGAGAARPTFNAVDMPGATLAQAALLVGGPLASDEQRRPFGQSIATAGRQRPTGAAEVETA